MMTETSFRHSPADAVQESITAIEAAMEKCAGIALQIKETEDSIPGLVADLRAARVNFENVLIDEAPDGLEQAREERARAAAAVDDARERVGALKAKLALAQDELLAADTQSLARSAMNAVNARVMQQAENLAARWDVAMSEVKPIIGECQAIEAAAYGLSVAGVMVRQPFPILRSARIPHNLLELSEHNPGALLDMRTRITLDPCPADITTACNRIRDLIRLIERVERQAAPVQIAQEDRPLPALQPEPALPAGAFKEPAPLRYY